MHGAGGVPSSKPNVSSSSSSSSSPQPPTSFCSRILRQVSRLFFSCFFFPFSFRISVRISFQISFQISFRIFHGIVATALERSEIVGRTSCHSETLLEQLVAKRNKKISCKYKYTSKQKQKSSQTFWNCEVPCENASAIFELLKPARK